SAYLKYLSDSCIPDAGKFFKKKGYFKVESETVKSVRASLGITSDKFRNPLTFLMEAADDTAYCVSDIEDGIEKGIIRWEDVLSFVSNDLRNETEAVNIWNGFVEKANSVKYEKSRFIDLKIRVIGACTDFVADEYIKLHDKIMDGKLDTPLYNKSSSEAKILDSLTRFARSKLFMSKQACDLELCSYNIIRGLLDHFKPLLFVQAREFDSIIDDTDSGYQLEKRLALLLPKKHILAYKHDRNKFGPDVEPFLRAHLLVDYISGMTDNHALHVFQLLSGISTKVRA
ncbi:MAG TPA: hypothetical protein VIG33_16210, partial [Pseudobdellovibrionaceae bacterium]